MNYSIKEIEQAYQMVSHMKSNKSYGKTYAFYRLKFKPSRNTIDHKSTEFKDLVKGNFARGG